MPKEQVLELQGITAAGKLTVAGLMIFGMYPQAFFPQLCITAVVVPGTEFGETGPDGERFIDDKRIEGTIPQMLEDAVAFVYKNMRNKVIITDEGKRADKSEYPMKAIREIILNALIHRDYSIHTDSSPIRLMMFDDRLELENPGGLYGRLTIDSLGKVGVDTRNPNIASALEILINTENRFSGIPTIRNEMKKAELPEPVFESSRGVFKVTLPGSASVKAYPEQGGSIFEGVVEYCAIPRSREELARHFGFDAPSYMIKNYVLPLVDSGKLKSTIPDKPKSKYQKYVKA